MNTSKVSLRRGIYLQCTLRRSKLFEFSSIANVYTRPWLNKFGTLDFFKFESVGSEALNAFRPFRAVLYKRSGFIWYEHEERKISVSFKFIVISSYAFKSQFKMYVQNGSIGPTRKMFFFFSYEVKHDFLTMRTLNKFSIIKCIQSIRLSLLHVNQADFD